MPTLLLTVAIVALAMTGLSIGYIVRGKSMRGGCGTGHGDDSAPGDASPCNVCGRDDQCADHDTRHGEV
ncbi:MAG: hypothetical protein GY851_05705 [bacterium]|nr:hypothetical protein [bacterium]